MLDLFRNVNFTVMINDIEAIDTDKQRITLNVVLELSWHDTRISCARESEVAEVTSPYIK